MRRHAPHLNSDFSLIVIIRTTRFILNKLYLAHVQKELHNVLVTHLLAHAGQRHSVHKNECEDISRLLTTGEGLKYTFFVWT
jgi:hypothetical protein